MQRFVVFLIALTQLLALSKCATTAALSRKLLLHGDHRRNIDAPKNVRLLVLVLAGGNKPAYFVQRAFWRLLAEKVQPLGVQVYLISTLPDIKEPLVDKETIHFPDNSTDDTPNLYDYGRYVSMSVDRYVEMMRYVFEKRPHGHDAPYILRSTLASFWCFSRLLRWLDGMPRTNFGAGVMYELNGNRFMAGAGFVLSSDVANNVFRHSNGLNRTTSDDLALAQLLHKMGVQMTPWRQEEAYIQPIDALPTSFANQTDFHQWRIVSRQSNGQASVQDAAVWASLFFYHYGPTMEMRHDAFNEHYGMCLR